MEISRTQNHYRRSACQEILCIESLGRLSRPGVLINMILIYYLATSDCSPFSGWESTPKTSSLLKPLRQNDSNFSLRQRLLAMGAPPVGILEVDWLTTPLAARGLRLAQQVVIEQLRAQPIALSTGKAACVSGRPQRPQCHQTSLQHWVGVQSARQLRLLISQRTPPRPESDRAVILGGGVCH
jgi:hypothetical protein